MPISEEETFTLVFLSVVLLVGSILVEYPVQWSTVHFGSYLKTSLVPLVALSLSWTHPDWFGSLSGPAQAGVGGMGVLATLGIWKSEQRKLEREQEEGPAKIELALEAQRGEKKARWGDWTFSVSSLTSLLSCPRLSADSSLDLPDRRGFLRPRQHARRPRPGSRTSFCCAPLLSFIARAALPGSDFFRCLYLLLRSCLG